ncbi:MAG TPA: sigma-70 family RNA polymerase sigma factor [Thermoleophilaceae bacterium]
METASQPTVAAPPGRPGRADVDPAAVELIRRHGAQVMSTARRYSTCREDAEDAYQRAIEILLTRAPCADADQLVPWLKTVVKHEAFAVARQRARHGMPSEVDAIEPHAGAVPGPAEVAERRDRLRVGAEALRRLKPQEVRALTLRAQGLSYREICDTTGWTYTKVNRCLSEGRRRFLDRVAGIEAGDECERLAPLLSALADGELGGGDLVVLRRHMHGCLACRARLREYRATPARAAALVPAPVVGGSLLGPLRDLLDGAAGWLSERSASLAVRWHQAAELAAAHKVAAVAASTAVLAGGSAVTVAPVDGGDRPAAAQPTAGGSIVPSTPPAPSGDESAGPRDASPGGGGAGRAAPRGKAPRVDRDPAPSAAPAGEARLPAAPAGEFTPDPSPPDPAATNPGRPAPAAGSGHADGGEFSP